ncbi:hypothetical protein K2173_016950 [Erythroxylum novogranatense]|uniref:Nuclear matrix constituent protein 1-like protein n=1 Tax=Erythroxylum novogranatense TaxID=1862640 RepID=A0AAV8U8K1_9ROSI|nr:hypothetical protein K2173_016950 [Erythroxylum novogranatense]
MFTPQRKSSPALAFSPRSDSRRPVIGNAFAGASNPKFGGGKGKAVAFVDAPPLPPPPVGLISDGGAVAEAEAEDMEDWKRFREAGLLNEAEMERKDREALLEKASMLEKKLFDYQYNMGLLLIEKKEWTSRYEEMRQALLEAEEIVKREQSAHLIALSEIEKREGNLREALVCEKQCVADLERALRSLQEEHLQIKQVSEKKLADAKSLVDRIEEKSSGVEEKVHSAEAKLADVNRKNSEMDMKLQELETREIVLQRERLSLNTEREAHKAALYKQKEDLNEWEKKLEKQENRLCDLCKTLNQREEKMNESDRSLKQRERNIEEAQKRIDLSLEKLKEREDDVDNRLSDLISEEKKVDSLRSTLEMKEKELLQMEEKLVARERMDSQELLDEHRASLEAKTKEFELELEEKQKHLDEELKSKVEAVKHQEVEILHREEKLGKLEQAFQRKSERVKEKEKDIDARLKNIKEREKSMKSEQKKTDLERKQLLADNESLQILKDECEKIRAEIAQQEMQIGEKNESLKITNEERLVHVRLQAELKRELEKCRIQQEFLSKEGEDLKLERDKFEKEWEMLEEKRAQISKSLEEIVEERENLKKLQLAEEKRLKREECAKQDYVQHELETIRMEKESLEARMRNEKLRLSERAKIEHDRMLEEFVSQKNEFSTGMINRREEMERCLKERESAFEELKEREFANINQLKEVVQREQEEMQSEKRALEKEKQEIAKDKDRLEEHRTGMQKDINELEMLSKKLCVQREHAVSERNRFLALVDKHKSCDNCRDITREFVLSDLLPPNIGNSKVLLTNQPDKSLKNNKSGPDITVRKSAGELDHSTSQGRMSWLQKCTSKIFSISPTKKIEQFPVSALDGELHSSQPHVNAEEKSEYMSLLVTKETSCTNATGDKPRLPLGTAGDSHDTQLLQSESIRKDENSAYSMSVDDHSYIDSKGQSTPDDSEPSERKSNLNKPGRRQKAGPLRTKSVKAVVEDAKKFLGNESPGPDHRASGQAVEKAAGNTAKKRQRVPAGIEQDNGESEGRSDSVATGGRRQKQQKVASVAHTPGQSRYNLRRAKIAGSSSMAQASSDLKKKAEKKADATSDMDPGPNPEATSALSFGFGDEPGKSTDLVQVTMQKTHEFSQERVELKSTDVDDPIDATKSVEITVLSEEVNDAPEDGVEDENGSTMHEDDEDEYDDDDGPEHPGQVSIGKKIWNFFTT